MFFPFLQFQLVFRWFFPISCAFESSESSRAKETIFAFGNRKRQVYIESIERDIVCRNTIYGACHHTRLDRPKHTTHARQNQNGWIDCCSKRKINRKNIILSKSNCESTNRIICCCCIFRFLLKICEWHKSKVKQRREKKTLRLCYLCAIVREWVSGKGAEEDGEKRDIDWNWTEEKIY